jgi:hypothetical protein
MLANNLTQTIHAGFWQQTTDYFLNEVQAAVTAQIGVDFT